MYADGPAGSPANSKGGPAPQNSGRGGPASHQAPTERSASSTPSFKTLNPLNEDKWTA